ncbi:hypothetical protein NPIL_202191 [Nephila pilipes]|uniref:Uncharacterized protein n=1 Tax=Nephila pilipes TaxID=299642 RepID=A0A8X6PUR0_NEPPI|nr:hypothetical protein NPIL_202191 [Nephila pilipes]
MFPCSSTSCPRPVGGARPNSICIEEALSHDQMLYHRTVMEPHTKVLSGRNAVYSDDRSKRRRLCVDVLPKTILTTLYCKMAFAWEIFEGETLPPKSIQAASPTLMHTIIEERPVGERHNKN